jgi:hypothetical protein
MSAEKETLRRVQDGLFHLTKGLTPFVSARMKAVHGERWLHFAEPCAGSPLDAYGLVKTMIDAWPASNPAISLPYSGRRFAN